MFETLKRWLWGTPPKTAAENAPQMPLPIAQFLAATRHGSPRQLGMIGSLAQQVTPWDFETICAAYAQGVAYVYQRYGTCPKAILLTDDPSTGASYNVPTQTIRIPRAQIAALLNQPSHREPKTEPFILTGIQMATLVGVEEAFHHFQCVSNPDKYLPLIALEPTREQLDQHQGGGLHGYDDNPLEMEAAQEMQRAIRHFGFDRYTYDMLPGARPMERDWRNFVRSAERGPESLQR